MPPPEPFQLLYYQTRDWRVPFREWIDSLADPVAYAAARKRLARLQRGLFGDCKPVGDGVLELRVDVGPGYRAYLKRAGSQVILLLCGGDKRTQTEDIKHAKAYWKDHQARTRAAVGTR